MTNPLDEVPVTITLKASWVNYIMVALSACPFRDVSPIIAELKTQGDVAIETYKQSLTKTD